MSFNKVLLIGRLGQNPELKTFENGNVMVKFSVATSSSYKDKEGKWITTTEWHECTAFGPTAERINKTLERGNQVHVEGKIQYRKYRKDGEETDRTSASVKVERFLKLKGEETRVQEGNKESDKLAKENGFVVNPEEKDVDFSSDLPF